MHHSRNLCAISTFQVWQRRGVYIISAELQYPHQGSCWGTARDLVGSDGELIEAIIHSPTRHSAVIGGPPIPDLLMIIVISWVSVTWPSVQRGRGVLSFPSRTACICANPLIRHPLDTSLRCAAPTRNFRAHRDDQHLKDAVYQCWYLTVTMSFVKLNLGFSCIIHMSLLVSNASGRTSLDYRVQNEHLYRLATLSYHDRSEYVYQEESLTMTLTFWLYMYFCDRYH
jgi:hypothetical protein